MKGEAALNADNPPTNILYGNLTKISENFNHTQIIRFEEDDWTTV